MFYCRARLIGHNNVDHHAELLHYLQPLMTKTMSIVTTAFGFCLFFPPGREEVSFLRFLATGYENDIGFKFNKKDMTIIIIN